MPFLPHAARDPGFFVDARPGAKDALSQFEIWWRYPAQVALFFFGLVNAGVPIGALEAGTWGVPIAVIVGKPLGILIAAGVALVGGLAPAASRRLARTDCRWDSPPRSVSASDCSFAARCCRPASCARK